MIPRVCSAFLLACLLVVSTAGLAAAHAELVDSEPADGDTIETPTTLTAHFSEALNSDGSRIIVRDAGGQEVGRGGVAADDPVTMAVDVPALPVGDYVARWTARAEDGHVTRGEIHFTVEPTPTPAPPTPAPTIEAPATDAPATDAPATPTAAPMSPSPAPEPVDEEPTAGTTDILMALFLAGAVTGGLALYLLRRR